MRPTCKCGNKAEYWYAPIIYKKMDYNQYLEAKAYCETCADTDNWAEYQYIGNRSKDWVWLSKDKIVETLEQHNKRLDSPCWTVSHVKEDGKMWHLGLYGGYHNFGRCNTLEDVLEAMKDFNFVEIRDYKY